LGILLDGKTAPKNITNGFGRKNKISFDTYQLDKDIRSFNRNAEMYLFAFNEDNKQSGIFKTKILSAKNPELLQMGDFYGYKNLVKAKNAEVYSYTKETYQEAPNVYISDNFKTENKISKSTSTKPIQLGNYRTYLLDNAKRLSI
jgi:hypothetical protein